jgi:hypothetical protein
MERSDMDQPTPVTFSFTPDAVNLILEGLALLPLARSMQLFQDIKRLAAEQIAQQKETHHG